jgi:exodeoxyribonuclease VII small subunit
MTATRKKSTAAPETASFRQAYEVLQRHAETLRNQREPDIDDLLRIVTESVDAYKVCRARIDAVEAALEQALADADAEIGGADGAVRPPTAAQPPRGRSSAEDDDTPLDDEPDADDPLR